MSDLFGSLHEKLVFGRRVRRLSEGLLEVVPRGSTILDVGCGDGQIGANLANSGRDLSVRGIDVLIRPQVHIPVTQFDGAKIPFEDGSFDVVMFVDVLHHTNDPSALLIEARRVTKRYLLLKDHFRTGPIGNVTLRAMDWFGNAHHGVVLPYNYLSESEWNRIYRRLELGVVKMKRKLSLYPFPAEMLFGRGLHFIALLEKK